MPPVTVGTSAVGRPSLLQAAVCHPSLSEAGTAPSAGTPAHGTQHQRPAPGTRCLHHVHSQLTAPAPSTAPAPAPTPSTSTSNLSPPRAQPAHSTSASTGTQHLSPPRAQPAHSTSTQHQQPVSTNVHSQLTAPAPAPSTSTSNLSPPRAQPAHSTSTSTGTRHQQPVLKARTGNLLLFEVRTL